MSKSIAKRLAPLMAVIAVALLNQPVFGQALVHEIIITENSSTSLTATYDGSTSGVSVTFNSANNWTVTFPDTVQFTTPTQFATWTEPENALANDLAFVPSPTSQVQILSDAAILPIGQHFSNGATDPNVGFDLRGGTISAAFVDKGDIATAPDTGSTLGLLSLSLIALLAATRLRSLKVA